MWPPTQESTGTTPGGERPPMLSPTPNLPSQPSPLPLNCPPSICSPCNRSPGRAGLASGLSWLSSLRPSCC